ncbi:MAG: Crp/Fnr family transcriptional regulator [Bacteroidota bacterium]
MLVHHDKTNIVRSHAIFKNLLTEETEKLVKSCTIFNYSRNKIIYNESNHISGCYLIHEGTLKIYKTGYDGKEQIIRFAKPGDLIGFRSVLSNEPACTTAETIQESILFFIPSDILIELFKMNGNFAMSLMRITCKELEEANTYLTDVAQKTVRERLAEVLLHLYKDFGVDESQFIRVSLTREELANIVGTATESVIRLLSEFKDDNLISISGRKINLLDISKLSKLAGI